MREKREKETTARLLSLFLSFAFYSFLPPNTHTCLHAIAVFNSMREQEQLHFLGCSIFADKLFSDQPSRRASIECDSD